MVNPAALFELDTAPVKPNIPVRKCSRFKRNYLVEPVYSRIVSYDAKKGYRMRWYLQDAAFNTWEPRDSLPHNIVQRFRR